MAGLDSGKPEVFLIQKAHRALYLLVKKNKQTNAITYLLEVYLSKYLFFLHSDLEDWICIVVSLLLKQSYDHNMIGDVVMV